MDLNIENSHLRRENARLTTELALLKDKMRQILSLSFDDNLYVDDNNNNDNNKSNKRIKISNDTEDNIYNNNFGSSNSTIHTNNCNSASNTNASTNTTTSTNTSIRSTKISKYDPTKEIHWLLQFDGGAKGNPGQGGAGAVLYKTGVPIQSNLRWEGHFYLGDGITNNVAEYNGILEGLRSIVNMRLEGNILVQGDSELVIKQLQGDYLVKKDHLKILHNKCIQLVNSLPTASFSCQHIRRELNHKADALSNIAIDKRLTLTKEQPISI